MRTDYMRAASRADGKKFKMAAVDCDDNAGSSIKDAVTKIKCFACLKCFAYVIHKNTILKSPYI